MQEAVKFPRSPRTHNPRDAQAEPEKKETREAEKPDLKVTLERPESIEALRAVTQTKAAEPAANVTVPPVPMSGVEIAASLNPAPTTEAKKEVPVVGDGKAKASDIAAKEQSSSARTAPRSGRHGEAEEFYWPPPIDPSEKTATFEAAKTPMLAIVTVASVLVALWSFASLQDARGQLAAANQDKASAEHSLAVVKGQLATTEKAVADVKAAIAKLPDTPGK